MNLPRTQPLLAHAHAVQLRHENEVLRAALALIVGMCENTTSAMVLIDVARIARVTLTTGHLPADPALTTGVQS